MKERDGTSWWLSWLGLSLQWQIEGEGEVASGSLRSQVQQATIRYVGLELRGNVTARKVKHMKGGRSRGHIRPQGEKVGGKEQGLDSRV